MFTFPVRIPLKMAMASEWDNPCVEWPFTDKISSPKNLTKKNSKLVAEFFFQGQSKKKNIKMFKTMLLNILIVVVLGRILFRVQKLRFNVIIVMFFRTTKYNKNGKKCLFVRV